jgi:hypothetical protein
LEVEEEFPITGSNISIDLSFLLGRQRDFLGGRFMERVKNPKATRRAATKM